MSRYWSDLVSKITPYVPGEQPRTSGLTKLNTNENPYPPSPAVVEAIHSTNAAQIALYPDPESIALRQALADRWQVKLDQVFVGNGSDEVLAFAFNALLKHDRPIYIPDITYSFYPVWSQLFDIECKTVPVTASYAIDVDAFPRDCGGVILSNPNAPTGMLLDLDSIRRLLERCCDAVVIIDEAYIDFGGKSCIGLIEAFDNLLVVQTMSKSRSLAGLRVGMAAGSPDLIEGLQRIKNSFNSYPLDVLAQRGALAALEDTTYFDECLEKIIDSRTFLTQRLQALGFDVLPSSANFVFVSHAAVRASTLFEALRQNNILVRYFDRPRIDNHLRITVGTQDECERIIQALEVILK